MLEIVWIVPIILTIVPWIVAYIKDKNNPDIGTLLAYAALGSTISSWLFLGALYIIMSL